MEFFTDSIHRTFAVDVAETLIKRGTRVTFVETAGLVGLKTCDADDLAIGTADEDFSSDTDFAAPKQGLSVRLFAPSAIFKANAAIAAATQLGKAVAGKVIAGTDLDYITHTGCGAANEIVSAYKLQ